MTPRRRRSVLSVARLLPTLAGLAALSVLSAVPSLAADRASAWTVEAMLDVPRPADVALAPDGRTVAYTVWRYVVADTVSAERGTIVVAPTNGATGAAATERTSRDSSAFDPRWSPDGRTLAFRSDRTGETEIWLLPAGGGAPRQLTASAAGVEAYRWLPDGRSLVYVGGSGSSAARREAERTLDDARRVDAEIDNSRLWRVDLDPASAPRAGEPLTPPSFHVAADIELSFNYLLRGFDVSPDGRRVVFTHAPTARVNDWPLSDVSVVDLATRAVRPVADSPRAEGSPLVSPDGRWIAYTAGDDPPTSPFAAAVHVVAAGGGASRRLALTADERPNLIGWSADGRELWFSEMRGTVTRLTALPLDGGAPHDLDAGAGAGDRVMTAIALDPLGRAVGFVGERSDEAPEVWYSPLDRFAPRRNSALAAESPAAPLGRTETIRWTSPDGLEIEGLLTYPVGHQPGRRCPLLLLVHGGPTWYFADEYLGRPDVYPLAAFAARGFALLRPNPRGSSGRGKAFRFANRNDWGGRDYEDLISGVDRLIALGIADPERMGVLGWSYGGYMTAWIVSQTGRFRAASVGAGLSNLSSFAGTSDALDLVPHYFGGPPWARPELYLARSPLFQIAGATTPTLIQHGEADRRVPLGQGEELYRALVRVGVETELVTYPRQGHSLAEPKLILDAARRNVDWFVRHLMAGTAKPPTATGDDVSP